VSPLKTESGGTAVRSRLVRFGRRSNTRAWRVIGNFGIADSTKASSATLAAPDFAGPARGNSGLSTGSKPVCTTDVHTTLQSMQFWCRSSHCASSVEASKYRWEPAFNLLALSVA
jgi:hypothetical protein